MTDASKQGLRTRAVHAGQAPDAGTGARVTPIHQSVAYVFRDVDHAASLFNLEEPGFIYSRLTNPTVSALQDRLADLEGGAGAVCTASGHAAQLLALFGLLRAGDEFVASSKLYGGSITQFGHSFARFGWKVVFVDPDDPENFRRAITDRTRAVFSESLANPGGIMCDLQAIADIAHEAGVPCVIDNTLATPALCNPIAHGADIVVHSTTKFLSGHGNAIGGAVIDSGGFDWARDGRYPHLTEPNPAYHGMSFRERFGELAYTVYSVAVSLRDLGPAMAPMNAYLTLTGIETLPLRVRQHSDNALACAEWLAAHPQVAWVSYAGLPADPYHALAKRYCPDGAGAVFTFGVRGGYEAGVKVVESVRLFSHLANIGDTRSLIVHPASTTHRQLSDEQKVAAGAGPEVIRLSVGIEDIEDIIADLEQALAAAAA